MNKINKKITHADTFYSKKNKKLDRLHNTNKDLKYWNKIKLNLEGDDETVYVLGRDASKQYECDVSNNIKIPVKMRGTNGKK